MGLRCPSVIRNRFVPAGGFNVTLQELRLVLDVPVLSLTVLC